MDGPLVNAPLRPDVSATSIAEETIKAEVRELSFFYGSGMQALKSVTMSLAENKVAGVDRASTMNSSRRPIVIPAGASTRSFARFCATGTACSA